MIRGITYKGIIVLIAVLAVVMSCEPDDPPMPGPGGGEDVCSSSIPQGSPYDLDLPFFAPDMPIPDDNQLTEEGVELGRYLFWEKNMSRDSSMSCGSCHFPSSAFSDTSKFSVGVNGVEGNRQAMALVNVGWSNEFFWDGRDATLEQQILEPIPNPIEMDLSWEQAVQRIDEDPLYDPMFEAAFGSNCVDSIRISKAIAQFVRTLVSFNSKFDKAYYYGTAQFTPSETRGRELFIAEGGDPEDVPGGQNGGDCFHCHGGSFTLFTDQQFHNNGLDSVFTDLGLGGVTGDNLDFGLFKTPTLRNVELSAPYMHDGRFETLEEVIDHYDTGGVPSPTIDPFMKFTTGGLGLSEQDKQDLINFLKTLTDEEFINNPEFQDPH